MNNHKQYERYQRQIILKEFGSAGQEKLLRSKVLVIGAGGLGCPALQYLTAAGVGTIAIVDDDIVSLNNLHRQLLYNMSDIGFPKAETAATKLKALNDDTNIHVYNKRLNTKNALDIITDYDIVIDGTDNFSSRYMINDACVILNKPLVYGAISKFEGQVAVFNVNSNKKRGVNYRDLFPDIPQESEVLNCADAGVLGVLPGIIGTMQANETIKLLTGTGKPLINKLLSYNALDNNTYEFNLLLNEEAQALIPKNKEAFLQTDYEWLCSSATNNTFEINDTQFDSLLKANAIIIDVREKDEQPFVDEFEHIQIPLNELMNHLSLIKEEDVVLFCQSGKRSLQAARLLNAHYHQQKKVYSLKGGVAAWKEKKFTERKTIK